MAGIGDYQGLCEEYEKDIETKDKEIERLRKEKEWLIQELSYRTAKDRLKVDGEMQQALEE